MAETVANPAERKWQEMNPVERANSYLDIEIKKYTDKLEGLNLQLKTEEQTTDIDSVSIGILSRDIAGVENLIGYLKKGKDLVNMDYGQKETVLYFSQLEIARQEKLKELQK